MGQVERQFAAERRELRYARFPVRGQLGIQRLGGALVPRQERIDVLRCLVRGLIERRRKPQRLLHCRGFCLRQFLCFIVQCSCVIGNRWRFMTMNAYRY